MVMVIVLNVLIAGLLMRAVYMMTVYWTEYRALDESVPVVECRLVRDHLEEWTTAALGKLCWQIATLILLFYGEFAPEPASATDLIVPLFILGFIFMVIRSERGVYLDRQRAEMWREELNGSRSPGFDPPDNR